MKKLLIVLVALMAMAAISVPAWAAEAPSYTFEMAARMLLDIGWQQKSKELTNNGSSDVGSWFTNVPAHSYLRATFHSQDKTVGGHVELGLKSVQPDASVSLRYAYGYWRIGKCRLLAGQTDNWFGSTAYAPKQYVGNSLDTTHLMLFGWGFVWPHRVPQVQYTYNTDTWGIQFALEEPRQKSNYFDSTSSTDTSFVTPRMTLTAMFKYAGFVTQPGVLWVQHRYEAGDTGAFDDSYNTWAIVVPFKYSAGPFTLKFQGHYGVNFATEIPFYNTTLTRPYREGITAGEIDDTKIYGAALAGEYSIGKMMLTAGFGYENFSNDAWSSKNGYNDDNCTRWAAFFAVPYQFTQNFGIHPELAYYNYGDNPKSGNEYGNEWLLGVQFRFIF